jgi:glycosyltransferase involved in cell wall biosynthesis
MRVLQLHTRYRMAGGEDALVAYEAQELTAAGHDVGQVVLDNPSSVIASAVALVRSADNTSVRRALARRLEQQRPDVAHLHNTWFAMSPSVLDALREARVPTVMTVHNYRMLCANAMLYRAGAPCEDCIGQGQWPALRHRCYRGSAAASAAAARSIARQRRGGTWSHVDLLLCPTEFVARKLAAAGIPQERLRVKPHFVPDPGSRTCAPSSSRRVVFVGRLEAEKGVEDLLEAWARHQPKWLTLDVVGDGSQRQMLESRHVPGVRFLGPVTGGQVSTALLGARALVFPSRWYETFGLVVAEALAAGIGVVVPAGGAAAEVAGSAALPFDGVRGSARVETLVGALRQLEDDCLVDELGSKGRARWEDAFRPGAGVTDLVAAYAEAQRALRVRAH